MRFPCYLGLAFGRMGERMYVHDNGNSLREMLAEACKTVSNQDVVIKTLGGETLVVYEPVTIFKDFIRFQDSETKHGNYRTINVPFASISSVSHK